MAVVTESLQEKYAGKIAKLLERAERDTTPRPEAEACMAKAQELMSQYAVEQAMVDAHRGIEREQIEQRRIYFTGNYRQELLIIAWAIARANNCLGVQWKTTHDDGGRKAVKVRKSGNGQYRAEVTSSKKALVLEITGFPSDLERCVMLETSLRLQSMNAEIAWWATEKSCWKHDTYARKVRARQEFLEGFANAVRERLNTAKAAGERAAVETEAEQTNQTVAAASQSVALVLRSRKDQVQDWYDQHYGKLGSTRAAYRRTVSSTARGAGREAGLRADVGQPRIGAQKGLNR